MSRLRAEPERLAALAERMAAVADRLARVRADVAARASHVDWDGAAAVRYAEVQERWASGAALLDEGLAELRTVAAAAADNYLAAARANRRMWTH